MSLSPGDRLGPYEILASIGAGGMGEVFKARDTRLGRIVALKRLKPEHHARFEQEARAIAALNHPYICQIHDIGPDYLILEYVEGRPLAGPLPSADAVRLAMQIAEALDAAHRKGLIHRDLKPANILVTSEGSVKLLDFGLAKRIASSEMSETSPTETLEGQIMGTAAYMSPEQAEGRPADHRSDIFSFGVVLYELLSGRQPFLRANLVATLGAILHVEPPPLDAPATLQAILTRCLAKSPADRFQAVAELRSELAHCAAGGNPAAAPEPAAPSIAVLPFANIGGDKENEYFSDGLAEEILNLLAKGSGLKVIARTSAFAFRGKEQDVRKIAAILGVANILEGSVRRAGTRVRVTAQLIGASDGAQVWADRFDREMADLFDLQDEIAQTIAAALRVKLAPGADRYRPSLPAYEALMKARHLVGLFRPDLFAQMKDYYEQAIALDPKFALAYSEYGSYFFSMAFGGVLPAKLALPKMRSLAEQALAIDPALADAQALLGGVAALLDYDWKEAEKRFHAAMLGDRVSSNIRQWYAGAFCIAGGKPAEALRQMELILQEDPLNLLWRAMRAACLAALNRDDEALEEYLKILKYEPGMAPAQMHLAGLYTHHGELDKAFAHAKKACELAPLPNAIGLAAGLARRLGEDAHAAELLARLQPADAFGIPRGLGVYHWANGEYETAAACFEKSIDQRDPWGSIYFWSWYCRPMRSTPLWARLMKKFNLPAETASAAS